MKYGLIGEKLGHSFSAEIHPKIAGYQYELQQLKPDEVEGFIKKKDFCGVNVTIPYKQTVLPFIDYIDDAAREIGAVNTIVNRDGVLYGYNTDFGGLLALINTVTDSLSGKKALVLGDGGTSHTAHAVLKHLNVDEIFVVSLNPDGDKISYNEAVKNHSDAQIILNATPVGMYPNVDGIAINIDEFKNLELVVDVVYNPLRTDLVLKAQSCGIPAVGGLYMLVAQAVLAAQHFTGKVFDKSVIDEIYSEISGKKRNIVLIGMPACGKTTIGKMLAEKLDFEFIDTDEEIIKREGMEITDIFKNNGEAYFRKVECEVIRDISLMESCVIATGGGAVLNADNIRNLKHNGTVIFLDRPLDQLVPTFDRPTANTKDSIVKRYNERIDIYNSVNDITVSVTNPHETTKKIINTI